MAPAVRTSWEAHRDVSDAVGHLNSRRHIVGEVSPKGRSRSNRLDGSIDKRQLSRSPKSRMPGDRPSALSCRDIGLARSIRSRSGAGRRTGSCRSSPCAWRQMAATKGATASRSRVMRPMSRVISGRKSRSTNTRALRKNAEDTVRQDREQSRVDDVTVDGEQRISFRARLRGCMLSRRNAALMTCPVLHGRCEKTKRQSAEFTPARGAGIESTPTFIGRQEDVALGIEREHVESGLHAIVEIRESQIEFVFVELAQDRIRAQRMDLIADAGMLVHARSQHASRYRHDGRYHPDPKRTDQLGLRRGGVVPHMLERRKCLPRPAKHALALLREAHESSAALDDDQPQFSFERANRRGQRGAERHDRLARRARSASRAPGVTRYSSWRMNIALPSWSPDRRGC